jgi:hypothetical protein
MYGQVIFHRRPDPSLKAAEVSFRLAWARNGDWPRGVSQWSVCWLRYDINNGCAPSRPRPIVLPRCSKIIPLPGDRQRRGE